MKSGIQGNVKYASKHPSFTPASIYSPLHIWTRVGKTKFKHTDEKQLYDRGFEEDGVSFNLAGRVKRVVQRPTWSNGLIQLILLSAFPKLASNPCQRQRASRWARIIYLYIRMALPEQEIAAECGLTHQAVKAILKNVRRHSRAIALPRARVGRPPKIGAQTD